LSLTSMCKGRLPRPIHKKRAVLYEQHLIFSMGDERVKLLPTPPSLFTNQPSVKKIT
jgi:hypothetical protein